MIKRKRYVVQGTVQGIGFRPFVYRLAARHGMVGFVANDSVGAEIQIQGRDEALDLFENDFDRELPPLAVVKDIQISDVAVIEGEKTFGIRASRSASDKLAFITPDAHVCKDCLQELYDPNDRRYLYPFINCTNCGPRFTIIKSVPYDRPYTTMARFPLCNACEREYVDPLDRRFHAQPVACPDCGPKVWLADEKGMDLNVVDPIKEAARWLIQGRILGVKGLGGFHLAVDGSSEEGVRKLRERKWREDKPLALMVRDVETARSVADLSPEMEGILTSTARPILLAPARSGAEIAQSVAPGTAEFGIMLPYTPLHHLLMDSAVPALVMTSGNPSAEPLAHENDIAVARLKGIADGFLLHDRDIQNPCDDSVVRWMKGRKRVIRRARGYAPMPHSPEKFTVKENVIALGPELKNTITVTRKDQLVLSQHLGDLTNKQAISAFEGAVDRIMDLLGVNPEIVVCDAHPQYFSTRFAQTRFAHLPVVRVQHHHAHMAAVMIEYDLDPCARVVAAVWDGTGYGLDGTTWGGEFFVGGYKDFKRVAHTRPLPLPGGDSATKHPWRIALSVFHELGVDPKGAQWLARQPVEDVNLLRSMLKRRLRCPLSGGGGRLFDAAAAVLDFNPSATDEITYEAQAAIEMEALCCNGPLTEKKDILPFDYDGRNLDLFPAIVGLLKGKAAGVPVETLAARFIDTAAWACARVCCDICEKESCSTLVLSGGCFLNVRFAEIVEDICEKRGLTVLAPADFPVNDGAVSLGQAAVALARRL